MRTATTIPAVLLGVVLSCRSLLASCDRVYGVVQPRIMGCDYISYIDAECFLGNFYGYAFLEIVHSVSADNFGQVYWMHNWTTGSDLPDQADWPGWPRQCVYTTANFFIQDPDTEQILLDAQGSGCGCLDGCYVGDVLHSPARGLFAQLATDRYWFQRGGTNFIAFAPLVAGGSPLGNPKQNLEIGPPR